MFIAINIQIDRKQYRFIVNYSSYILIIAIIVILYQQLIDPYFFVNTYNIENLIDTTTSETRLLSIYSWIGSIAVGFGFVPILILVTEDFGKRNKNIIFWIIIGLIFAFLTKARWIMLNSLLVFVIVYKNYRNNVLKVIQYALLFPIIGVTFFFVLNFIGIDAGGIVKDRIFESDKKSISQTSAGTRLLAFEAFNQLFWDNPILGVGEIKSVTGRQDYKLRRILAGRSSQIHVGYLALLYKYGVVGGVFFLSFLFLLLRKLYRSAKRTKIWAPFLGILGFALANLTLVYFSIYQMGLILVLVAEQYYSQNYVERSS